MDDVHRSLDHAQSIHVIKNGWEATGLWPFNPEILSNNKMIINNNHIDNDSSSNKRKKRGPDISSGKILFDGNNYI